MMNPSTSDDFISANSNIGEISVGTVKIYPAITPGEVKKSFRKFITETGSNIPWERIYLTIGQYYLHLYFNSGKLDSLTLGLWKDEVYEYDMEKVKALYAKLFAEAEYFPWGTAYIVNGQCHDEPPGISIHFCLTKPDTSSPSTRASRKSKFKITFYSLPPLLLLFAWLRPVNNGITRWLIVFGTIGVLTDMVFITDRLWRRKRKLVYIFLLAAVGLIAGLLVPSLSSTPLFARLRNQYVQELRSYEGTRYLWGGENRFGIDCSGLPRKAMRNALVITGLKNGNSDFILSALKNWWFDASAKALSEEYRNCVYPLNVSGTVKDSPTYFLQPGDLAITDDGVHVMIYLSPNEWISADPGQDKVVIEHPSESKNPWFTRPVHFFRFRLFQNAEIRSGARTESMRTAWQNFLKGSQTGCCLSTPDTYAKNPHWNVFVSYGRDYTLSFLAERLDSKTATGQYFCGLPKMNEGEVALVCLERISGKSILKYSGNRSTLKKIIANADGLAAPYFYVVSEILKNPEALDAVRDYLLESERSVAKP